MNTMTTYPVTADMDKFLLTSYEGLTGESFTALVCGSCRAKMSAAGTKTFEGTRTDSLQVEQVDSDITCEFCGK